MTSHDDGDDVLTILPFGAEVARRDTWIGMRESTWWCAVSTLRLHEGRKSSKRKK